ncbi:hypothetical protein B7463_g9976, partial [Scytalidium lignicola]
MDSEAKKESTNHGVCAIHVDIYGPGKNVVKSQIYKSMVHRAPNTLTTIDKKEHSRKRRVLSHGFSDAALRNHEEAIIAQIQNFKLYAFQETDPSQGEWSSATNLAHWCDYLTFDIMANIVFGETYEMLKKAKYRYAIDAIEKSNVRISVLTQAPELSTWRLDRYLFTEAIKGRNMFIKFVNIVLRDRLKPTSAGRKDIFSLLIDAKDPETGKGFGMAELGAESTTLIVAGSDTSSTALAALFFYLCTNPKVHTSVCKEVRQTFTGEDEIRMGAKLNSCLYLRACIDEAMRMSPPVGSALWREVSAPGVTVDNLSIAAGCDVGTGIYSIHHNAEYFSQPFKYLPERWLAEKPGAGWERIEAGQGAYAPFSYGPRGCIGKGLAIQELMLTMAIMIFSFDFRIAQGQESLSGGGGGKHQGWGRHRADEYQLYDHITGAKNGPLVEFRVRNV